jgi:hypothetical protein
VPSAAVGSVGNASLAATPFSDGRKNKTRHDLVADAELH